MIRAVRGFGAVAAVAVFLTGSGNTAHGAVLLEPGISVSEEYTDNLFFSATDRQSDLITSVDPTANLVLESQIVVFSTRYQLSAEFHARHPEADRYGHSLTFDLGLPFLNRQVKGFEIRVKENVSYLPDLPAFPAPAVSAPTDQPDLGAGETPAGQGIQTTRTDTFRNVAGIVVKYQWNPRLTTDVWYDNEVTRYKDKTLNDLTVHDLVFRLAYQWSVRTRLGVEYSPNWAVYEEAGTIISRAVSASAEHQLTSTLSLRAMVGILWVVRDNDTTYYSTAIRKKYGSGNFSLQYQRVVGTGSGLTLVLTMSDSVTAQWTHTIGKETTGILRLGYGDNRSFSIGTLDLTTYEASIGVVHRWRPWLTGSLTYSYLNQKSSGTVGEEGHRNTAIFMLTAGAPPWKWSR